VLAMPLPGVDPRKIQKSMELFAREVMPYFRRRARRAISGQRSAKQG
jgi:hypothetical protein